MRCWLEYASRHRRQSHQKAGISLSIWYASVVFSYSPRFNFLPNNTNVPTCFPLATHIVVVHGFFASYISGNRFSAMWKIEHEYSFVCLRLRRKPAISFQKKSKSPEIKFMQNWFLHFLPSHFTRQLLCHYNSLPYKGLEIKEYIYLLITLLFFIS